MATEEPQVQEHLSRMSGWSGLVVASFILFICFLFLDFSHLLCVRRRGHVLPLHEVRSPLHLRPVHHHPHGARRGLS